MYRVAQEISWAGEYWGAGWTGKGVDVAGTYDYADDTIQSWSSRGDGPRNPGLSPPAPPS
jgi:hypothetical protein